MAGPYPGASTICVPPPRNVQIRYGTASVPGQAMVPPAIPFQGQTSLQHGAIGQGGGRRVLERSRRQDGIARGRDGVLRRARADARYRRGAARYSRSWRIQRRHDCVLLPLDRRSGGQKRASPSVCRPTSRTVASETGSHRSPRRAGDNTILDVLDDVQIGCMAECGNSALSAASTDRNAGGARLRRQIRKPWARRRRGGYAGREGRGGYRRSNSIGMKPGSTVHRVSDPLSPIVTTGDRPGGLGADQSRRGLRFGAARA